MSEVFEKMEFLEYVRAATLHTLVRNEWERMCSDERSGSSGEPVGNDLINGPCRFKHRCCYKEWIQTSELRRDFCMLCLELRHLRG